MSLSLGGLPHALSLRHQLRRRTKSVAHAYQDGKVLYFCAIPYYNICNYAAWLPSPASLATSAICGMIVGVTVAGSSLAFSTILYTVSVMAN
jgi:hypothetical protein